MLLPADCGIEQLSNDLATELDFEARLAKSIRMADHLPFGTMRAGMQLSEGTVPDFVATNMDGSRRLGVPRACPAGRAPTSPSSTGCWHRSMRSSGC